jgi:hypothetical protein
MVNGWAYVEASTALNKIAITGGPPVTLLRKATRGENVHR